VKNALKQDADILRPLIHRVVQEALEGKTAAECARRQESAHLSATGLPRETTGLAVAAQSDTCDEELEATTPDAPKPNCRTGRTQLGCRSRHVSRLKKECYRKRQAEA
jgi:hypothetical protein